MRFLLLNDNPVVNKLVTLSAQKTGDDLVVSKEVDDIAQGKYDLLIIDHAIYTNALLDVLEDKISYRRSLFIAHRGEEVPEGFDKVIYKPFLPTDLVEYFSTQLSTEDDVQMDDGDRNELPIEDDTNESIEELDLDLELLDALPEIDDTEIEDFDLDDVEDDILLSDLDDLDLGGSEVPDEVEGGVLDEDELLEVQGLLEDDAPAIEETLLDDEPSLGLTSASMEEVNGALADLDGTDQMDLGLDERDMEGLLIDDELSEEEETMVVDGLTDGAEMLLSDDLEEMPSSEDEDLEASLSAVSEEDIGQLLIDETDTSSEGVADDTMDIDETMLLDEESLAIEDEMDLSGLEDEIDAVDKEEEAPGPEMVSDDVEKMSELDDASMDELVMLEEDTVSASEATDDIALLDDDLDAALDMDAEVDLDLEDMEILDEELESAVNALSEEELAQDIDETMMADMIGEPTETVSEPAFSLEGFEEFDSLNVHDLKVALGEAEEVSAASESDDLSGLLDGDDTQVTVAASDEGVEALHELTKTLKKVLKDDSSAAALQGMKINVNITFGDAR